MHPCKNFADCVPGEREQGTPILEVHAIHQNRVSEITRGGARMRVPRVGRRVKDQKGMGTEKKDAGLHEKSRPRAWPSGCARTLRAARADQNCAQIRYDV